MRASDYFYHAFKSIRSQPVRAGLTMFAMAISATLLITLAAISIGTQAAVLNSLNPGGSVTTIMVTTNKSTLGLSSLFGGIREVNGEKKPITEETLSSLAALPNVTAVSPVAGVWEVSQFRVADTPNIFVAQTQAIQPGPAITKTVAAGTHFKPNEERQVAILGYAYAKKLGYATNPQALLGKQLFITTQKGYIGEGAVIPRYGATKQELKEHAERSTQLSATIIGITHPGVDENSLLLPMQWARKIRTHNFWETDPATHKPVKRVKDQIVEDGYTAAIVKADHVDNVPKITETIEKMQFGATATLDQINQIKRLTTIVWAALGAVSLVALIAASLGIINTMLMSVSEQRRAIGVWRACGATKRVIARRYLLEAAILGCLGGIGGALASLAITRLLNYQVEVIMKAQNLPVLTIAVAPWWLLVASVLLTIIFGILAGLYPAIKAAREDPSRALAAE